MTTLAITFKGSDESQAAAHEVAGGLRDVGAAADEAGSSGRGFFGGMLESASGFLAANVVGAIAGKFTDFIGGAISDAREANQIMAQTEQIIQTTGGAAGMSAQQVADLASSLSAAAGKSLFGDDQIQGAENVLLKYRELKGVVPDVTKLAVDMAQRLGTEPAAAAETLGRALQNPFDAEAKLAKQGIILDEQQKAMLESFKATGDTAGAQKFLIDDLNKTYGGSAEAAAKADGGYAQFQDRIGELGETLGQALLPALGALIGVLNDYVMPALEGLAPVFDQVGAGIGQVIGWFSQAGASSGELGGIIGELGGIWQQLQEVIGLAVELIQATVVPAFQEIAAFLSAHSAEINAVLSAAWTIIKTTIEVTLAVIKGIIATALALIKGDWSGAWEAIKTMFSAVWQGIQTILSAEIEIAKNVLSMAWDAIKGTVQSAWDGIKSTISTAIDTVVDTIMGLPDRVADVGSNLVAGIQDGFASSWDSFVSWVIGRLDGLKDQVLSFFGISSPSAVMADEVGEPLVMGILEGMQKALPALLGAVQDLGDDLLGKVQDLGDQISNVIADAFDATASIDRQAAKNIDAVGRLAADMQGAVQAALDEAKQQAAQIQDPQEAADFFKERSDQILELAKMESEVREANAAGEFDRANRIRQQIELIKQAQAAEQSAFAERQKGQSETEQLGADVTELQHKLDEQAGKINQQLQDRHLSSADRAALMAQLDAIHAAQEGLYPIAVAASRLVGTVNGGAPVLTPTAPLPAGGAGFRGSLGGAASGPQQPAAPITVNVYPAQGMNERQLAEYTIQELQRRYRGRF